VSWGGPKWSAVYLVPCEDIIAYVHRHYALVCVLCSQIKTITHWHLICSRRAQQCIHENSVKALSDEHNDHDGVEPRSQRLPHQGGGVTHSSYRALRLAPGCSCLSLAMRLSRFLCRRCAYPPTRIPSICQGAHMDNAQIAPLGSCPWGQQISRQTKPTGPPVNHAQHLGKSMSDCSQFSKCYKTKQSFTCLRLQPRGL
jgi:hypothetical protein